MATLRGVFILVCTGVYVTFAYDDPVTGECGKDWEKVDPMSQEMINVALYSAHYHDQVHGSEFQTALVRIIEAEKKKCRWPKYNYTAIYGESDCRASVSGLDMCPASDSKPQRMCNVFVWVPPGRGGRVERFECL